MRRPLAIACTLLGTSALLGCHSNPSGPSCADRTAEAQNAMASAVAMASADLSCTYDSDCVVASNSTTCWVSCGAVLNRSGQGELLTAVEQVNATTCLDFSADGCEPNPAPPCAPVQAFCNAGKCSDVPPDDAGTEVRDASSD